MATHNGQGSARGALAALAWAALLAMTGASAAAQGDNPLGLMAHHITARVHSVARASAWYHDVLGFRLLSQGERLGGTMKYADLEIPGFGVSLVELDQPALAVEPGQALVPSWIHIVFAARDPDHLYRTLRDRGVHVFTRGPETPRVTTFLMYDSEGNEIEIVAAPPS
jgi:catechol 2,3-dioxygenase-like lactoylglutathione lyase family enzyme